MKILTLRQLLILRTLIGNTDEEDKKSISGKELAVITETSQPHISKCLYDLERYGYVQKIEGDFYPTDRGITMNFKMRQVSLEAILHWGRKVRIEDIL